MKKAAILFAVLTICANSFCMRKRYDMRERYDENTLAFYNKTNVFPETGDLDEIKYFHSVSINTIRKSKEIDNMIFLCIFSQCTKSGKYGLAVWDAYKKTFDYNSAGIEYYPEEIINKSKENMPQEIIEIWDFMKETLEKKLQALKEQESKQETTSKKCDVDASQKIANTPTSKASPVIPRTYKSYPSQILTQGMNEPKSMLNKKIIVRRKK